jgi:hypothetical protein
MEQSYTKPSDVKHKHPQNKPRCKPKHTERKGQLLSRLSAGYRGANRGCRTTHQKGEIGIPNETSREVCSEHPNTVVAQRDSEEACDDQQPRNSSFCFHAHHKDPTVRLAQLLEVVCNLLKQSDVGGSVWESNPPSWPRRTGSMALKATRITGSLSPPRTIIGTAMCAFNFSRECSALSCGLVREV